jgi:hypothetical protein
MNNTKAMEIYTNYEGKNSYANHQHAMHTEKIKPIVETRRKSEVKIMK